MTVREEGAHPKAQGQCRHTETGNRVAEAQADEEQSVGGCRQHGT